MVQESQDAICESLETLSQANDYYRWLFGRVSPYIRGKVLEIGAGIGNFAKWAKPHAREYHVSEDDPRLVEKLRDEFDHAFQWDIYESFSTDELYDTVVILNVVEHLKDDVLALQAIRERLVPGGHLVLMVPAMQFLYGSLDRSFGHFRRYTKRSMTRVVERVPLEIIKKQYVNAVGMAGWFVYSKVLKRDKLPHRLCGHFNLTLPLLKLERPIAVFAGLSLIVIARKN